MLIFFINCERPLPADFQFAPDGFGSRSACNASGAPHFNWFNRQKSSQTVNPPALLFLYKKTNHSGYIVNRSKNCENGNESQKKLEKISYLFPRLFILMFKIVHKYERSLFILMNKNVHTYVHTTFIRMNAIYSYL